MISVYKTIIKYKVLLLEESECCETASPDSYNQDNRGVKKQLNIDDGRLTEMKKIHFDFLNPVWMQKDLFFFFFAKLNNQKSWNPV